MSAPTAMTVVVMGYRNEATIVDAVASVLGQVAPEPFEVVVVTSGGDGSAAAVRSAFPDVVVVESEVRLRPGGARNSGVAAATGETVAFLAADCLAEPGWVAARLAAHRAGHPVVAGAMTTAEPSGPSAWAFHFDLYYERLPGRASGPIDHPDPAAHGCSFARAVLDRMGPFDPHVDVGEDTDAARRLRELGIPLWFEARVRTAHRGPATAHDLVVDRYRRGIVAARASGATLSAVSPRRALLAAPVLFTRGLVRTVSLGWRTDRSERSRLVLAMPWLVAGRAAGLVGWYRERIRSGSR